MTEPRESGRDATEDIAIVGMACLYPGADNPARFWQNIVDKVDCIGEPPRDWQPELFLDPSGADPDRAYVGKGGYLGDLCRFDPLKYGVVPNSVEGSEPDQFVALRCAFEAMADAGFPEIPVNTSKTAVIVGRGTYANRGYFSLLQHGFVVDQVLGIIRQINPGFDEETLVLLKKELKKNLPPSNADTAPGVSHSVLVGRIANRLNLNGPAYTIDAACASSLIAAEHGMRYLRSGSCDAVLAGGVQVSTVGLVSLIFCHLQALSRTGHIAPLSANATGTLLGSGCGMLVLKRRSDAERDGNRIYCVMKSVGVASDGRAAGLLAPVKEGQQLAIDRAYEQAHISPLSVELIEAHATGIPLGDTIEIQSLNGSFGLREGTKPTVALGSVKSSIGHLIPAAGSASLIKTALALYHRVLPPTLHGDEPSSALPSEQSRFYLSTEPRPWIHGGETPRRAGVDAFGFGGINAHALLEEYAEVDTTSRLSLEREWPMELVVVSAESREALRTRVAKLADWVEAAAGVTLLDVAAACAKETMPCRVSICATSIEDLIRKSRRVAEMLGDRERRQIQDRSGVFWYEKPLATTGRLAFVFPGEGSQYPNMLSDLARHFAEVRKQFDLTDRAFSKNPPGDRPGRLVFPLLEEREAAEKELFGLDWAVEAVAAANRGLFDLARTLGLRADAVMGHSSGEFVALWAAGALELESEEDLAECIARGSRCTREIVDGDLVPHAVLTTVGGIESHMVERLASESGGEIQIAVDNCPHQMVIAGSEQATARAVAALRRKGAICQRFPWDRAYHTEGLAKATAPLEAYIRSLELRRPEIELWSCATADRYPSEPVAIRELAVRQWTSRVRFRETVERMYESGVRLFLEVGPRGNLTSFIDDILKDRPRAAVALNVPRTSGVVQLCHALGMLAAHGVSLNLDELTRRRSPRSVELEGAPPKAAKPDPVLRLDLPELKLGEAAVRELGVARAGTPRSSLSARSARASGEGPVEPARARALADYQRTMRQFLETQRKVMTTVKHPLTDG